MAGHRDHRERVKTRVKDRERLRDLIATEDIIGWLDTVRTGVVMADPSQIRAAEILLSRTLPTLSSVEAAVQTEITKISAEPLTEEAWAEKHANVGPTEFGSVN